ncbi:hypothetical protein BDV25DRAFT_126066 [Aspergillus avenaceus]|uniref:Uncharacterized protein n=1 Tax=Aspergillus avenaceus TaxID=36643 RepID=A0A5N6U929_ASPAV|nr:hypothetical protein BDV25DRAFT_126066 [Aspergillus avenaceus]
MENLPPELRIQIFFSCHDLVSIRSIVHASPIYHQTYQLIKHRLLLHTLHKTYDGLVDMTDAITAVRSYGLYAYEPSHKETILALLDRRRRSKEICRPIVLTTDEIIKLFKLHGIANFFLDEYAKSAPCPKWIESAKWVKDFLPLYLSRTEKVRFLRGFYLLQIYANIFGPVEFPAYESHSCLDNDWIDHTFTRVEAWRVLFGTMAPWEVAEFGCVWQYIYDKIKSPYIEIAEKFREYKSPGIGFPKEAGLPEGCIQLDGDELYMNADEILRSLVATGPVFCSRFLRLESSLHRRDLILANGRCFVWCFPFTFPATPQGQLPLLYPADRFDFGSDWNGLHKLVDSLQPWEGPNFAFRKYWLVKSHEGEAVFQSLNRARLGILLWRWGYAIWDAERLQRWSMPEDRHSAFNLFRHLFLE